MKIEERSYSSKLHRPRPSVYLEPDGSFLLVSTSWGDPEHAQKVNNDIAKYVQASMADVEVTSPFEVLTVLSREANYLRIAALIANEQLYRGENKGEYMAGVETLLLLKKGLQVAYAQVGAPHLLLQKNARSLIPVSVGFETCLEMGGPGGALLAPLPQSLLGADLSLNIRCGDFKVDEGDRLVLYAGAHWPESFWTASLASTLPQWTQKLVQKDPEAPFWLGLVDLAEGS